eukprot:gene9916-18519_t
MEVRLISRQRLVSINCRRSQTLSGIQSLYEHCEHLHLGNIGAKNQKTHRQRVREKSWSKSGEAADRKYGKRDIMKRGSALSAVAWQEKKSQKPVRILSGNVNPSAKISYVVRKKDGTRVAVMCSIQQSSKENQEHGRYRFYKLEETGKSTDDRLDMVISLINDIKVENKEIFQKLEKRLDKFEKLMEFINKQFENHKAITESLIKRNTKLEECNANLTKQVNDLNGQIQSLRQDHNDLEQDARRETIEIGGTPREKDQDTIDLVLEVGKALGISVDEPGMPSYQLKRRHSNNLQICLEKNESKLYEQQKETDRRAIRKKRSGFQIQQRQKGRSLHQ